MIKVGLRGIRENRVFSILEVIKDNVTNVDVLVQYVDTSGGQELLTTVVKSKFIDYRTKYLEVQAHVAHMNQLAKETEKVIGKRTTYSNVPKSLIQANNLMEIFLRYLYNRGYPVKILSITDSCQWIDFDNGQTTCLYTTQSLMSDLQRLNLIFEIDHK